MIGSGGAEALIIEQRTGKEDSQEGTVDNNNNDNDDSNNGDDKTTETTATDTDNSGTRYRCTLEGALGTCLLYPTTY